MLGTSGLNAPAIVSNTKSCALLDRFQLRAVGIVRTKEYIKHPGPVTMAAPPLGRRNTGTPRRKNGHRYSTSSSKRNEFPTTTANRFGSHKRRTSRSIANSFPGAGLDCAAAASRFQSASSSARFLPAYPVLDPAASYRLVNRTPMNSRAETQRRGEEMGNAHAKTQRRKGRKRIITKEQKSLLGKIRPIALLKSVI